MNSVGSAYYRFGSANVVEKINRDLRAALSRPDIVDKLVQQGNYTRPRSRISLPNSSARTRNLGADRHRHRLASRTEQ